MSKLTPIEIPPFLANLDPRATVAPSDMLTHMYFILRELIERLNAQITEFNQWADRLLTYSVVEDENFIQPLSQRAEKILAKLRQKLATAALSTSPTYLDTLVQFYPLLTSAITDIAKVYRSAFQELESKAEAKCKPIKDPIQCLEAKFKPAPGSVLSQPSPLCEWRKRTVLGFGVGSEVCTPSTNFVKYVATPAKADVFTGLVDKDTSQAITNFIRQPVEHVLYQPKSTTGASKRVTYVKIRRSLRLQKLPPV